MRVGRTAVAAGAAVLVLAGAGVAVAVKGGGDGVASPTTTSTSTTRATTTTRRPTTTTTAPTTTTLPPDDGVLAAGDSGPAVEALQRRLNELHFDPGPVDGRFGSGTTMAVWAFQKLTGQPADGRVTPAQWQQMQSAGPPAPMMPDGGSERVEIDLARQVMLVYEGGALRLATHVSTGSGRSYCENGHCGDAVTPGGSYRFTWRYSGWRTSPLGQLYNPVYFNGGIAVHGASSVPSYPASHGCVRIPMHIAEYFPSLVARGDPVYVFGGSRQPVSLAGQAPPPLPPPPPDPPASSTTTAPPPSSTTTTTKPPAPTTTKPPTTTTKPPTTTTTAP